MKKKIFFLLAALAALGGCLYHFRKARQKA